MADRETTVRAANRKNKAHFFRRVTCPPRCLSHGRLPGRAVAGRWDPRSASALIRAGGKTRSARGASAGTAAHGPGTGRDVGLQRCQRGRRRAGGPLQTRCGHAPVGGRTQDAHPTRPPRTRRRSRDLRRARPPRRTRLDGNGREQSGASRPRASDTGVPAAAAPAPRASPDGFRRPTPALGIRVYSCRFQHRHTGFFTTDRSINTILSSTLMATGMGHCRAIYPSIFSRFRCDWPDPASGGGLRFANPPYAGCLIRSAAIQ
jgi:hypothetical protein